MRIAYALSLTLAMLIPLTAHGQSGPADDSSPPWQYHQDIQPDTRPGAPNGYYQPAPIVQGQIGGYGLQFNYGETDGQRREREIQAMRERRILEHQAREREWRERREHEDFREERREDDRRERRNDHEQERVDHQSRTQLPILNQQQRQEPCRYAGQQGCWQPR